MAKQIISTEQRFWAKVAVAGADECWRWLAADNGAGYGMIWHPEAGRKVLAHRFSYQIANGPIPDGQLILHSCDNRFCVNPAHLRAGTHKENVADMDLRNRRVTNTPKGEANYNAIVTDDIVIAIRQDYVAGVAADEICRRHGVKDASLRDYTGGRSWQHVFDLAGCPSRDALKAESARRRRNNARLDMDKVREIRRRLAAGESGRALAAEFGIHPASVSDIKHHRTWPEPC